MMGLLCHAVSVHERRAKSSICRITKNVWGSSESVVVHSIGRGTLPPTLWYGTTMASPMCPSIPCDHWGQNVLDQDDLATNSR